MFAIFAIVVMAFVGCQKDENVPNIDPEGGVVIKRDKVGHTLKKAVITKPDYAYVLQNDGTLKAHKTLKIRDLKWEVVQEWFVEDLHTDIIPEATYYPNDPNGSKHGVYYPWHQIADQADDGWGYIVYKNQGYYEYQTPFRLPRVERSYGDIGDFDRLDNILGNPNLEASKLKAQYDGYYFSVFDEFCKVGEYCTFWIEARRTSQAGLLVPGCGVVSKWEKGGSTTFWYLSIKDLKMNVRLMRDIRKDEW